MTTRICTSRSTVLLAGPALIAVLAILAGTPVWTASTGSSRLSVASLVAMNPDVLPAVELAPSSRPSQAFVSRTFGTSRPLHTDRHRIGLLRLVLPPPSV